MYFAALGVRRDTYHGLIPGFSNMLITDVTSPIVENNRLPISIDPCNSLYVFLFTLMHTTNFIVDFKIMRG